jgi:hypothetical protein
MGVNGQPGTASADGAVLRWAGRVVAAEDLRRSLNGHRELVLAPRTIVTPLAAEDLKARGVKVTRQAETRKPAAAATWAYAEERPQPMVRSAVQSLERDGIALRELPGCMEGAECPWTRTVAECVARGDCAGGVVFCQDVGLACCVANKVGGLRAAAVVTVAQAARATLTLGANLLVVEVPGRTYFEVRQILRILCQPQPPICPPGVACTLRELDGHAHR